jgi:hypothetical protein
MNIDKLIHDLRARISPQYYDQLGTESYERHQCVMALESLLARNEVLREESERLRKDAERFNWIALNAKEQLSPESLHGEFVEHKTMYVLPKLIAWADFCGNIQFTEAVDYAIDAAIDAARGTK